MDNKTYIENLTKLWKKNMPLELPKSTNYPFGEILVTDYLKKRAELTPDKSAIIYYGREISFKELDDNSSKFASYLSEKGINKGDRVAVFMSNCPQFLIAFYGILKLGAVHVPVNPMFKEEELLYELNDSQAKLIIATDQLYDLVEKIQSKSYLQKVVTTSLMDFLPENPTLPVHPMYLKTRKNCKGTDDLLTILEKQSIVYPNFDVSLDDIAALNYTGGTTGFPKGCVHTQRDMLYTSASACTYIFCIDERDIALQYWPAFWIAGEVLCVLNPVISGATHVILGRWDPETVMKAINDYKVTLLNVGVDNIVEILEFEDRDKYNLRSLRVTTATSLSMKLDLTYRKQWKEFTGCTVIEATWGMTETHTYDTFTSYMHKENMDLLSRPVFVGLPIPGTKFKVTDFETGELLPLGKEGELLVSTPSLFKEYWNKPKETNESNKDGWFHTGDMGMIDEDGFIHFLGRNKEMLKVNGMSVFPPEVEVILARHPAISSNGIVGMPHNKKGEVPVAFVTIKKEYKESVSEEDIHKWCSENMATYKVPIVKIVEQLPMTATGKVIKRELEKILKEYIQ
ncbi:AMP-binding protein [Oceanobacillus halophilus]|uniref:Acyl-CoA synthetase n=1 Tax=Oceanobacillus halophilus TaxID=930130 RepID=A0A495A8X2_9BACI|nr:AMP-binding protein [Oceanobacillus halophilus]RKQ35771.1 acyl-CoA synthetase [Oceanobacillus halophilus]